MAMFSITGTIPFVGMRMGMHVVVTVCAGTSRNWYKRRKNRQLRTFSGYACGYRTTLLTVVPLRSDHTGYGFDTGYVCTVVYLETVTRFSGEITNSALCRVKEL